MQYPILAALFVVLLVLYVEHWHGQRRLAGKFQGRIDRLQHEIRQVETEVRKNAEKTDAVKKECVGLQHGLTSVSNQMVGMRKPVVAQQIDCNEPQDVQLE